MGCIASNQCQEGIAGRHPKPEQACQFSCFPHKTLSKGRFASALLQVLEEGGNAWCKYGVAQMQGWRMTMVRLLFLHF
jgi:hypothetical protein